MELEAKAQIVRVTLSVLIVVGFAVLSGCPRTCSLHGSANQSL